jgi:hypothetical protein
VPPGCIESEPTAVPDGNGVEWFLTLAIREPQELEFNTITFGIGVYDPAVTYILRS